MTDQAKIEHGEDWRSQVGGSPGELSDDLIRAREPGRGREASSPQDIPARGWKDIFWRVFWSIVSVQPQPFRWRDDARARVDRFRGSASLRRCAEVSG